ncbi:hypothetical protein BJY59DRAFT_704821 [Rhodotorula toruloides]
MLSLDVLSSPRPAGPPSRPSSAFPTLPPASSFPRSPASTPPSSRTADPPPTSPRRHSTLLSGRPPLPAPSSASHQPLLHPLQLPAATSFSFHAIAKLSTTSRPSRTTHPSHRAPSLRPSIARPQHSRLERHRNRPNPSSTTDWRLTTWLPRLRSGTSRSSQPPPPSAPTSNPNSPPSPPSTPRAHNSIRTDS